MEGQRRREKQGDKGTGGPCRIGFFLRVFLCVSAPLWPVIQFTRLKIEINIFGETFVEDECGVAYLKCGVKLPVLQIEIK
jgi:hypothetical protein